MGILPSGIGECVFLYCYRHDFSRCAHDCCMYLAQVAHEWMQPRSSSISFAIVFVVALAVAD